MNSENISTDKSLNVSSPLIDTSNLIKPSSSPTAVKKCLKEKSKINNGGETVKENMSQSTNGRSARKKKSAKTEWMPVAIVPQPYKERENVQNSILGKNGFYGPFQGATSGPGELAYSFYGPLPCETSRPSNLENGFHGSLPCETSRPGNLENGFHGPFPGETSEPEELAYSFFHGPLPCETSRSSNLENGFHGPFPCETSRPGEFENNLPASRFNPMPYQNTVCNEPITHSMYAFAHSDMQLKKAIKKQIEYYFSNDNLKNDLFIRRKMDSQGYVPLTLISTFYKVKSLTNSMDTIIEAVKDSSMLELADNKLRPLNEPLKWPLLNNFIMRAEAPEFFPGRPYINPLVTGIMSVTDDR